MPWKENCLLKLLEMTATHLWIIDSPLLPPHQMIRSKFRTMTVVIRTELDQSTQSNSLWFPCPCHVSRSHIITLPNTNRLHSVVKFWYWQMPLLTKRHKFSYTVTFSLCRHTSMSLEQMTNDSSIVSCDFCWTVTFATSNSIWIYIWWNL